MFENQGVVYNCCSEPELFLRIASFSHHSQNGTLLSPTGVLIHKKPTQCCELRSHLCSKLCGTFGSTEQNGEMDQIVLLRPSGLLSL